MPQARERSCRDPLLKFALYEPVEFVATFLGNRLDFEKKKESVAIHVPCSSKKMKLEAQFLLWWASARTRSTLLGFRAAGWRATAVLDCRN